MGGADIASLLDNKGIDIVLGVYAALLLVVDSSQRNGLFLVNYESATIVKLADYPIGYWSVTNTDGNPGWAIYKGGNTFTVTLRNYTNTNLTVLVNVLGVVMSVSAPY